MRTRPRDGSWRDVSLFDAAIEHPRDFAKRPPLFRSRFNCREFVRNLNWPATTFPQTSQTAPSAKYSSLD